LQTGKAKTTMADLSIQSILKKKSVYKICGTLWMDCDGERFFGPGRVELLQKIDKTGSINKAAKEMEMSYKKAWEMINELNTQARQPLVITQAGGEKGGGSVITEQAKQLIKYHQGLRERFQAFLENETLNFNLA
jgi:molybdate transport system regulatory protein